MARRKKNRSVVRSAPIRKAALAQTVISNSPGQTLQAKRAAILAKRLAFAQSLLPNKRLAALPVSTQLNTGQTLHEAERRISRLTLAAQQLQDKKEPVKKQSTKLRDLVPHCKKRPDKNTTSGRGSGGRKVEFIPWC